MTVTISTIGIGTAANDKTGDEARTAFDKCNDNFGALKTAVEAVQHTFPGTNVIQIANAENVGGNVLLYDTDHATKADDVEIRSGTAVTANYDASASQWQFQTDVKLGANLTFDVSLAKLTSSASLVLDGATAVNTTIRNNPTTMISIRLCM